MKIWAVTLVGMASVFVPSALWGQNQRLTGQLQQLFDCAEQNNASLIRMRAAIATAEAGEETARLAQLPDVEAQLSISYLGDARLWNRTFGESMAAPMPHFGNNFLLRAEQVVYSGEPSLVAYDWLSNKPRCSVSLPTSSASGYVFSWSASTSSFIASAIRRRSMPPTANWLFGRSNS